MRFVVERSDRPYQMTVKKYDNTLSTRFARNNNSQRFYVYNSEINT